MQLWLYLRIVTTAFSMSFKSVTALFALAVTFVTSVSCDRQADTPQQAADMLTAIPQWEIQEISVNDAITFKDGKMTQQFGGIDFQRYMEKVQIKKNGVFSGTFKGENTPFLLKWQLDKENITIGATGGKGKGEWTVKPQDVHQTYFLMKTQSTAYDYPRMTSIVLKFKAAK